MSTIFSSLTVWMPSSSTVMFRLSAAAVGGASWGRTNWTMALWRPERWQGETVMISSPVLPVSFSFTVSQEKPTRSLSFNFSPRAVVKSSLSPALTLQLGEDLSLLYL